MTSSVLLSTVFRIHVSEIEVVAMHDTAAVKPEMIRDCLSKLLLSIRTKKLLDALCLSSLAKSRTSQNAYNIYSQPQK